MKKKGFFVIFTKTLGFKVKGRTLHHNKSSRDKIESFFNFEMMVSNRVEDRKFLFAIRT
jgi:hypothetical protein